MLANRSSHVIQFMSTTSRDPAWPTYRIINQYQPSFFDSLCIYPNQAVVRGTTNPAPVLPRSQRPKTAISLAAQDCQKTTIKPNSYGLDAPPNNPGISATKSVMGGKTI